MGLLYNLFKKDIAKAIYEDNIQRKNFNTRDITKKNKFKDFIVKTVGYINVYSYDRNILSAPEYDFDEIKKAAETDSYIKIALDKQTRLIYKAGYYLKSENEEAVKYLNSRFRIMSYATGKPMDILYQEIAEDLNKYANSFVIKTRVNQTIPGIKMQGVFGNNPVGGYFRVDPSTITIERDDKGNIIRYIQTTSSGKEKKFKPIDVIHFYMNKESSNAFGTPKIIAAMEDVKLLRRLEGNVLTITHRFASPIFHWKIGKTQAGFQASDNEIEDARREIESMSVDGVVITNEKTDIAVLGAEGNAINVTEYLRYFEGRVFSALDTSASQMGRGGAKQDANSMEAQSHDYVKFIQKTISIFVENFMLSELLLEGGFDPLFNEKDIVTYNFNEINLETKIKVENHEMLKYQSNMQTLEEARRNIGIREEVNKDDLYKNSIEVEAQLKVMRETADVQSKHAIEMAKLQHENNMSIAKSNNQLDKGGLGNLSNGKKEDTKPNHDVEHRNRPTNQNGTTSVKVKESLDMVERKLTSKEKHKNKFKTFYIELDKFKNDIVNSNDDIEQIGALTLDSMHKTINGFLEESIDTGIKMAIKDCLSLGYTKTNIDHSIQMTEIDDLIKHDLKATVRDIIKKIKDNREFNTVNTVIESLEYRFRFTIEYYIVKAKWYAYLKTGAKFGATGATIDFDGSSDAEEHDSFVDVTNFNINDIPAFHPFCDCKMIFTK